VLAITCLTENRPMRCRRAAWVNRISTSAILSDSTYTVKHNSRGRSFETPQDISVPLQIRGVLVSWADQLVGY
jgi:hypothetical protein